MGPSGGQEQTGTYGAGAEVLHSQDAKFADKAIACGLIIAAATVSGFDPNRPIYAFSSVLHRGALF